MAELLNRIPTNLTEYPNSFKRQGAFPLEAYSVFYTLADAETYAATNAISYVGQTLAVVSANATDPSVVDSVTLYIIADAAGTLQEVGKATNGDGNSITLTDGVLSLTGFDAAGAATLPQKAPVYKKDDEGNDTDEVDHYELRWVTIDAIVEGDGNTKTVVASDDTKVIVTAEHAADSDTYTYKVKLDLSAYSTSEEVGTAISTAIGAAATDDSEATGVYAAIAAAEARAKAYADENDTDTVYDDTALTGRVKTLEDTVGNADSGLVKAVAANTQAISDLDGAYKAADSTTLASAKTYTDEEISGLSVTIEQKNGVEFIVVKNKAGNEVASANASKFVQDSFLEDVAYDSKTGKVSFTWTMGDGSSKTDEIDIAHLVDTYTAGTGLTVTNNEFAVDTSVIATVEALNAVRDTAEAAQTAEEVATAIDAKIAAENLSQYAKAADVEATYAKAADVVSNSSFADFTAANTQAIADARTGAVADVEAKGYAVASEVATTYATKQAVEQLDTSIANTYAKQDDVYTITEVDELIADANTANQEAVSAVNKGLTDYITANDNEVKALKEADTQHTTDIAAALEQANKGVADAAAVASDLATLSSGAVATNTADINAIKGRLTTVETASGDHETRIGAAEGKLTALEGIDAAINTKIGTIEGNITTLVNEDARLAGLIQANTNKFDQYDTSAQVDSKVQAAVGAIDLTPYAKTSDVAETVNTINAAIDKKANADAVYTKTEADAAFMTETEVDSRINALINAADPDGGKTITDIQNLVKYVDENAGDIAGLLTTVGEHTTAIKNNADAIAAIVQPKESNEISVADDGVLGIKEVNVNKLVQTAGETLVLFGGNASVTAAE